MAPRRRRAPRRRARRRSSGLVKRMPDTLLGRVRTSCVAVAEPIGARLVADGAAELLEGRQIALAGEEKASAAVVPDRASLLAAVAGFDLGQVVEAEQELDSLARTAGGVAGEAWDPCEVGRLIEGQEQPRC